MPVRAIKQIQLDGRGLVVRIPKAIVQGINLRVSHADDHAIFVCEFKKYFDSNKKVIAEINQSTELYCGDGCLHDGCIQLTDTHLMTKFGFLVGEYLEIVFKEIKKTVVVGTFFSRRKTKTIPIFPNRMVEDLNFVPE